MASQFGPLLRRLRQRAGMTQEALAERSKLGVRTVRRLETGERTDPRIGTVEALANALDLAPAERVDLFAAAGDPEPPPPPEERTVPDAPDLPDAPDSPDAEHDRLTDAGNRLAYELRAQLQREEEQRQIHDPVPLPVRWQGASETLLDSWSNINSSAPGETASPLDLQGRLDQIVEVYQRIPSGRLVVLGRAGSGKTILTMRFVLGLLDVRDPADPVPVIFHVGSWQPDRMALRDWLIEQLLRDHPGLAAVGADGTRLAESLVETGRILPVLDGFDEIATGLHRAALRALNSTTLPLLLTSRVDEYRAAVESIDVLTSAAAVMLTDLAPTDLADYLPRTTRRGSSVDTVWEPVLAKVRDQPDGDLAAVLRTPLMISLARTIYSDAPDHDPAELVDTHRFGSREAIERHLLGSFVPTVYRRTGDHPSDPDRATYWLGFLANHLDKLGTHDLAWWQLADRMRGWQRMLVMGTIIGIAVGTPAGIVIGLLNLLGITTTDDGLLVIIFSRGTLEGLAAACTVGLAYGTLVAAGASRFRLLRALGSSRFRPARVRMRLRGANPVGGRVLGRLAIGLVLGIGLAVGLTVAKELGASFWLVAQFGTSTPTIAVFGVSFGLLWGLVWAVLAKFETPVDITAAASPLVVLNTNRRTVVVQCLVFGLTSWVAYAIAVAVVRGARHGAYYGASYGLVLGIMVCLSYACFSAWGTWLVFARVWLPLNGKLPWSLPTFLEDAYRRGILRRAGAVYQFRHARLQDHLQQTYRRSKTPP